MPKFIDHTGERFGNLVALKHEIRLTKHGKVAFWFCRCDCGTEKWISANNLTRGNTISCGCKQEEHLNHVPNPLKRNNPRLYSIWTGMKTRCLNPNSSRYSDYGGRGVTVCFEWMEFNNFCLWAIDNGYQDGLTLERIDNDKSYCPENCTWISLEDQAKNKRNLRFYTYDGKTMHLAAWAREYNLDYGILYDRLALGMPFEKALTYKKTPYFRIPVINPEDDERVAKNKGDYQKFIVMCDDNLSETKIAKEIGMATSTLQKWKNGKCHPNKEHMKKIIEYINVDSNYFDMES